MGGLHFVVIVFMFYLQPCRSLDLAVIDALERFHNADVLLTSEVSTTM